MRYQTKASLIAACFLLVVLAAVGLSSLGCNSDLGIEEQTYQCATNADCGDGLECRTGQCADIVLLEQRCEAYCGDFMETCNDKLSGQQFTFEGSDECMGICETYPINGTVGDESGNSLECRRHHMELAKISNPVVHCAHASPRGTHWCGDTTKECLLFCYNLMEYCTGENRQFDTSQRCLGACSGYIDDETLGCRARSVLDAKQGFEVEIGCENAAAESPICEAN